MGEVFAMIQLIKIYTDNAAIPESNTNTSAVAAPGPGKLTTPNGGSN